MILVHCEPRRGNEEIKEEYQESAEEAVRDIRRAFRRQYSAEEKIRIVLEGLWGEDFSVAMRWF